MTGSGTNF
jgi:tetratricopeptide (TPR) repeat protein